jgi:hypothetical protein
LQTLFQLDVVLRFFFLLLAKKFAKQG